MHPSFLSAERASDPDATTTFLHIIVLSQQNDADGAGTALESLVGVSREAPEIEFGKEHTRISTSDTRYSSSA